MASFGENLKREREMRGVTLQEISAATKISVRLLEALETENFEQLPGGIFTRSFIRAYAKYLGLDDDQVMAEYHLAAPARSDFDLTRLAVSKPETKREGSHGPLIALLLAGVLLGAGYFLYRYSRRVAEPRVSTPHPNPPASMPAPPTPTPEASAPSPAAVPPEQSPTALTAPSPATASVGATTGTTSVAPPPAPPVIPQPDEGLTLQVAATERSWVAVDADRKTTLQRVLNPGEVETLKAKDSFDVTTGNALGIVLTLNGETLKPLGRRGEVKSVHLTRNDVKKTSP